MKSKLMSLVLILVFVSISAISKEISSNKNSKPLTIPDFSKVQKSQKKSSGDEPFVTCTTREGKTVSRDDPEYEGCVDFGTTTNNSNAIKTQKKIEIK